MRTKQSPKNRAKAHVARMKTARKRRLRARGETAVKHSRRKLRVAKRRRRK